MNAAFGYFKSAHAGSLGAAFYIAFKAKTKYHQPVAIATGTTFFDGIIHLLFAYRAELRTDMEIRLLLSHTIHIKSFGMKHLAAQQFHTAENNHFLFAAILDACTHEVLLYHFLKCSFFFIHPCFGIQFFGADGFIILQSLHREGTAYS